MYPIVSRGKSRDCSSDHNNNNRFILTTTTHHHHFLLCHHHQRRHQHDSDQPSGKDNYEDRDQVETGEGLGATAAAAVVLSAVVLQRRDRFDRGVIATTTTTTTTTTKPRRPNHDGPRTTTNTAGYDAAIASIAASSATHSRQTSASNGEPTVRTTGPPHARMAQHATPRQARLPHPLTRKHHKHPARTIRLNTSASGSGSGLVSHGSRYTCDFTGHRDSCAALAHNCGGTHSTHGQGKHSTCTTAPTHVNDSGAYTRAHETTAAPAQHKTAQTHLQLPHRVHKERTRDTHSRHATARSKSTHPSDHASPSDHRPPGTAPSAHDE
ncbi:hypothetical protein BD410DRAFT_802510 [Rickenella mellea]|uniref:Uncharacterized protein n=1 Tax=Rickenella mellea TaxID=50990 RepID=A0A4Y7Q8R5_9AGAM|nr:hypothetical protein BD410DRAFT_802510 [Rickenella mellea]